jgi:hypothetical protein
MTTDLSRATWRKARASESANGCLEVAYLDDGRVAIRDTEDLGNPPFVVSAHVWTCFLDGAKNNEFNLPS